MAALATAPIPGSGPQTSLPSPSPSPSPDDVLSALIAARRGNEVLILNPYSNSSSTTSQNRARRYVKKGRALWIRFGVVIRFVTEDEIRGRSFRSNLDPAANPELKSAEERRLSAEKAHHLRMTGMEYDRTGNRAAAFVDHLRHIPVISADKLIRQVSSTRDWSYRAGATSPASVTTLPRSDDSLEVRTVRGDRPMGAALCSWKKRLDDERERRRKQDELVFLYLHGMKPKDDL